MLDEYQMEFGDSQLVKEVALVERFGLTTVLELIEESKKEHRNGLVGSRNNCEIINDLFNAFCVKQSEELLYSTIQLNMRIALIEKFGEDGFNQRFKTLQDKFLKKNWIRDETEIITELFLNLIDL